MTPETTAVAEIASERRVAAEAYQLITELYPICRSITGEGNRRTLRRLQEVVPLKIREVPTGTEVFDWTIPKEWNIRDAYIKNRHGDRIVDFQRCNLHVVSYSVPVKARINMEELREHLITEPKYPEWVPYRTTYYKETWGFCLAHSQLEQMTDAEYEVCIDSSLEEGSLSYGELLLPGESEDEVLFTCHICHPSICNDNLSGISVAALLARELQSRRNRYSYRFLFVPGSIGSIAWLALNESGTHRIKYGLVLSNLGDAGKFVYKRSRRGNANIDRIVANTLRHAGVDHELIDFSPYGYDERQYCSPGFNLPVGRFSRTPHGCYPEYHTSADDLNLVKPESLGDSYSRLLQVVEGIESDRTYLNLKPKCEPRLGKRNLYSTIGGLREVPDFQMALLWILNLSDGEHSLLDVSERSKLPLATLLTAAKALCETDLLKEVRSPGNG